MCSILCGRSDLRPRANAPAKSRCKAFGFAPLRVEQAKQGRTNSRDAGMGHAERLNTRDVDVSRPRQVLPRQGKRPHQLVEDLVQALELPLFPARLQPQ